MGRAGQGGYGTVQHAYDTRLKRDVAIKFIKITQTEMMRSQLSIREAQAINASRPLLDVLSPQGADQRHNLPAGGAENGNIGQGAAGAAANGFVPLTAKISEPSFLSSRERLDENRARRHSFLRERRNAAIGASRGNLAYSPLNDAAPDAASPVPGYGCVRPAGFPNQSDGDGFSSSASSDTQAYPSGASEGDTIGLSDFEGYSNFKKGPAHTSAANAPARRGTRFGARTRQISQYAESFTVGLSEVAGSIPGQINGAGKAEIASIDNAVNIGLPKGGLDSTSDRLRQSGRVVDYVASNGASGPSSDKAAMGVNNALNAANAGGTLLPFQHTDMALRTQAPFAASNSDRYRSDYIPGLEEARTAAHLNDVNIVTVYDCVVEGDMAYIIMEYVEGKTLARIMRDLGNDITLDMVAAVFNSVSHALEVAHKAGVLHLDVKPENVIINNDGVVKVMDFGLSTLMDASGEGVTGGGTIGYMPLEQMRQQRLDVRTDEWALASLTYEMLSGRNPFKARTLREAEAAIEGAELVIPSLCWDSIDESVDDIIFDALSPEMDGRYPDIKSFASDLTPVLGDAKAGRNQLISVVKEPPPLPGRKAREEQAKKHEKAEVPYVPFIDRLGMRGSNIMMRIFAALGAAMFAVISCLNFRYAFDQGAGGLQSAGSGDGAVQSISSAPDTIFGLFSIQPIAAGCIVAILVVLACIRPRWALPGCIAVFFVMLAFNQAWLVALLFLAGGGAWWWFFGRANDMACTLVLLQPLLGSFGFTAVIPVISGALLDIRDALAVTAMTALGALVFASLGSGDVMNWDVFSNFIVAVNPSIAGTSISNGFIETVAQPQNWIIILSWLAASAAYSFVCRKGTRAFDIAASLLTAVIVIAGTVTYPLATSDVSLLTPLTLSGAIVAAIVGVIFALLSITDRVRLAPGEW